MPNDCKDAVVIGCQLVCNLQSIISRNVYPGDPATINIGRIESGTQANIIASSCNIIGSYNKQNN